MEAHHVKQAQGRTLSRTGAIHSGQKTRNGADVIRAANHEAPPEYTSQIGKSTYVQHESHGFSPKQLLTRRNFLIGAGGVAAAALVAGGVTFANKAAEQANIEAIQQVAGDAAGASTTSGDVSLLNVPDGSVFTTEQCTYIDNTADAIRAVSNASLPYGTILTSSSDDVATCLLPGETSSPLVQIGLLALGSGQLTTAISEPVGKDDGFQIYDARANSAGVVWTEADILNGLWRIYHAPLSNLSPGAPVLVAEGDGEWEMPRVAISGNYSFWQIVPNKQSESYKPANAKSQLMRAPIGGGTDAAESVYEAKGSMACAPSASASGVAFVPRADISGTYYQLTHINSESGEVTDCLILPQSMVPTEIAYGPNGFSFSFNGIYSYGGGIANLGTYTPASPVTLDVASATANAEAAIIDSNPALKQKAENAAANSSATTVADTASGEGAENAGASDGNVSSLDVSLSDEQRDLAKSRATEAVTDLYSAAQWFRFPRTPLTAPAWCGNWFIVKSTNVVAGVDLEGKRYFTLSSEGNGESYGEFLASTGNLGRFVTYANLDYTPINGTPVKECSVRVWEAV